MIRFFRQHCVWKSKLHDQRGFTLIEMLVTIFLFSMIATIGTSGFVRGLELFRRTGAAYRVQDNALYVLEIMTREIRYSILQGAADTDCTSTFISSLTINHPVNGTVTYTLANGVVRRTVGGKTAALSGSDVNFEKLFFCISGSAPADNRQVRVTILAQVRDVATGTQSQVFNIQTTVALRDVLTKSQY